jgi:hypothetical protein
MRLRLTFVVSSGRLFRASGAQELVALLRRLGQLAQESGSPSGPVTSGPPQEPRKQGRSKITPTAMMSMTNPMTPSTSKKTVMTPF